ncbi:acetylornithine aminotransferase [Thiogranum longum]|uniref:Acetylornithine aminotransferase n=1 Tax=Thiogranum longum TaxID=1537524 RepID=A0A4R1HAX2_9GAMM|nr:acetylornithine transaminase [Thiogranum longum]TCK19114.1 acetylornithine aminotransferase [Thiogranum longum]
MPDHLMNTYLPLPVSFTHGEGAWIFDTDGTRYLDALGGIAVCALGHAHPAVTKAICEQAGRLLHSSNLYRIENQDALADTLCEKAGMRRVFFSNSGAEANEAALKLARLYGHQKGIDTPQVIVTEGSFHGRTMATLTATGNRKIQAGFEPLVAGFLRAPYNDIEALRTIAGNSPDVVAILVEPITGEGGIRIPDDDYLTTIRALCDEHGWLMMLDEIQTGMGRTGRWFAHQHAGIKPDVMTLAKALGNGVPIGACLANGPAADVFKPGNHGSTFGGNPLATRAALAVVDTIEKENLVTRAAALGDQLLTGFQERLGAKDGVTEVRGKGLMLGIELNRPCGVLVQRALDKRLLINVTAENVVRLLPPLILSDEQAVTLNDSVCELIETFLDETP